MAGQKLTTVALNAVVALAALVCLGTASPFPARANLVSDIVYHLRFCGEGEPQSPCSVNSATISPPPGSLDGIEQAIEEFYGTRFPGGTFSYIPVGANKTGYVFGRILGDGGGCSGGGGCDTQFIFHQGQILCCTIDYPYQLEGLNDNVIFIGRDGLGTAFIGSDIGEQSVTPQQPTLDASSIAALDELLAGCTGCFWEGSTFLAIDNANRISGVSPFGDFVLIPVPEPSSGLLVVVALTLLLLLRQRTRLAQ